MRLLCFKTVSLTFVDRRQVPLVRPGAQQNNHMLKTAIPTTTFPLPALSLTALYLLLDFRTPPANRRDERVFCAVTILG
jgi:hypothetical protein